MTKEKQKIISDICPFYKEYGSCEQCNTATDIDDPPCYYECMANAIIANGYRKRKDLYQILPDGRLELIPTSDNIKSKLAEDLLSEIKKEAHNKAVHPCGCKIDPYISLKVLDGIIQKYINKYYEEGKRDG